MDVNLTLGATQMKLEINGLKVDAGSGPGSRGGHVIGKTSSGKPIYASAYHREHGNFNSEEHKEAAAAHQSEAEKHESYVNEQQKKVNPRRDVSHRAQLKEHHERQAHHHRQYASGAQQHRYVAGEGFNIKKK